MHIKHTAHWTLHETAKWISFTYILEMQSYGWVVLKADTVRRVNWSMKVKGFAATGSIAFSISFSSSSCSSWVLRTTYVSYSYQQMPHIQISTCRIVFAIFALFVSYSTSRSKYLPAGLYGWNCFCKVHKTHHAGWDYPLQVILDDNVDDNDTYDDDFNDVVSGDE